MNQSFILCACLLAAGSAVTAADFTCTALPGTFEHKHKRWQDPLHPRTAPPEHWSSFSVSFDGNRLHFGPAMVADSDATSQTATPAYDLAEVEADPDIVRAFSGGTFDPLTGRSRVTRAYLFPSPVRGRFVLNIFDFNSEFTTHYAVKLERFKADCGVGPAPIPLTEYVPLMKRTGLWLKPNTGPLAGQKALWPKN